MNLRAIAIIVALLSVVGCDDGRGQAPSIQSRLESTVAAGAATFDFAADTGFAWDRMFIFVPYCQRAPVEKALGFSWPDYSKTTVGVSDGVVLVVFVQGGKVVGWYEQPRNVELGDLSNEKGYTRSEAVFDIDRSSGRGELTARGASTTPATRPAQ